MGCSRNFPQISFVAAARGHDHESFRTPALMFQIGRISTADKSRLALLRPLQAEVDIVGSEHAIETHPISLDTSANRQQLSHPSRHNPVASSAHPCKLHPSAIRLKPAPAAKSVTIAETPDRQSGNNVNCQCLTHGLRLPKVSTFLNPSS
jgi:hypothetical protein